MVNISDLETLLDNTTLQAIDNSIADKVNSEIIREDLPIIIKLMKQEVDASMLSIAEIESFINERASQIIDFGVRLLGNDNTEGLSVGIAITYAIYLIYLDSKEEKELLEYNKRRRIPKAQSVVKKFQSIKQAMNE